MGVSNYQSGVYGIRPSDELIATNPDWYMYASKQALRNPLSERITADTIDMIRSTMPLILESGIIKPRKGVKIRLALTEANLQGLADPIHNTIIIDMVNGGGKGLKYPGVHILQTLVHELVHSEQFQQLRLTGGAGAREYIGQDGKKQVVNMKALYNNKGVMSNTAYMSLPWEKEAFARQVSDTEKLYQKSPVLMKTVAGIGNPKT